VVIEKAHAPVKEQMLTEIGVAVELDVEASQKVHSEVEFLSAQASYGG